MQNAKCKMQNCSASNSAFCILHSAFRGPMARLTKLTKDEVTPEIRSKFTEIGQQRGNVPNMFRVYAHRPEILKTMLAHMNAITNSGTVPVRTKELVATLVSRINACEY